MVGFCWGLKIEIDRFLSGLTWDAQNFDPEEVLSLLKREGLRVHLINQTSYDTPSPGNSAFSWPFWDGEWKRDPFPRIQIEINPPKRGNTLRFPGPRPRVSCYYTKTYINLGQDFFQKSRDDEKAPE